MSATVRHTSRESERGQIIVIFALALVAIIAMVGLVLDGGSAFAQRRDRAERGRPGRSGGRQRLRAQFRRDAGDRPCPDGRRGQRVHSTARVASSSTSRSRSTNGAEAQVDISAPHRNNFASIVGMPTWTVATTAKAQAGYPDTANGAGPIIFSIDAFGPSGQPLAAYGDKNHPFDFGETNGDIPSGCERHRLDRTTGRGQPRLRRRQRHHHGRHASINKTIAFGEYIGQHNNG